MTSKTLAIVMPVWNNWQYTKNAIRQLSQLPEDHKLIIVDNGSTDETKNLRCSDFLEIIRNEENIGFAKGSNAGFYKAQELGYENVLFLNNDIKVLGDFDSWTLPLITEARKGLIAGPTVGCLDDNFNFVCEASKFPTKGFAYMSGWCLCGSLNTWQNLTLRNGSLGPFDASFFAYFEDTDLSFRAKAQGIGFGLVPVPVKHFGRVTGKKLGLSEVYSQSKKIFFEKWGGK